MKIAAWNVETLGCKPAGMDDSLYELYHELRGAMIAAVITIKRYDVTVIQEVREASGGQSAIRYAVHWLNRLAKESGPPEKTYGFDIVGCGLTGSNSKGLLVAVGPESVNCESYAVIFRKGTIAATDDFLSQGWEEGGSRDHYITLSTKGAVASFSGVQKYNIAFSRDLEFSCYPEAKAAFLLDPDDAACDHAEVPKLDVAPKYGRDWNRESDQFKSLCGRLFKEKNFPVYRTRRPCVVMLSRARQPTTIPFLVYHAPVNDQLLAFGCRIALKSGELEQSDAAILAGDLNARENAREELFSFARGNSFSMFKFLNWQDYINEKKTYWSMVHYCEDCEGNVAPVTALAARRKDKEDEDEDESSRSPEDFMAGSLRDYIFVKDTHGTLGAVSAGTDWYDMDEANKLVIFFALNFSMDEKRREQVKSIFLAIIKKCGNCNNIFAEYWEYFTGQTHPPEDQWVDIATFLHRNLLSDHVMVSIDLGPDT